MKKLLIAFLAILMLTACGKEAEVPAAPVEEPEVIHTPVEEESIVAQPEENPVEATEPEAPSPYDTPEEDCPIDWETTHVEGLLEDTVAYDLEQLTFSGVDGAEVMSQFYADLVTQLEKHTKENVYPAVMEQHTMANVYGIVSGISFHHDMVEATYEYRVEYLNGDEPESFTRTDCFDVHTGEVITSEE